MLQNLIFSYMQSKFRTSHYSDKKSLQLKLIFLMGGGNQKRFHEKLTKQSEVLVYQHCLVRRERGKTRRACWQGDRSIPKVFRWDTPPSSMKERLLKQADHLANKHLEFSLSFHCEKEDRCTCIWQRNDEDGQFRLRVFSSVFATKRRKHLQECSKEYFIRSQLESLRVLI